MSSSLTNARHDIDLEAIFRRFDATGGPRRWKVESIRDGKQARAYLLQCDDGRNVSRDGEHVVVKAFWPQYADPEAALDEFKCLQSLHEMLDGVRISDWTIRTPAPIFWTESPLAIVMTRVPGVPLAEFIGQTHIEARLSSVSIAEVVADVLHRFWNRTRRLYGDLTLDNILCDPTTGMLSFIDPGMPQRVHLCEQVSRDYFPASRDLAYLLFGVAATNVKLSLTAPLLARRRQQFVEHVMRSCLGRLGHGPELPAMVEEIRGCLRVYLKEIRVSASIVGAWRLFVRRRAARKLDALLSTTMFQRRAELAESPSMVEEL